MKIPFTLDAWLKDKSQKIETRSGKNVRIICWDKIGVPIVALVGDADDIVTYNRDGTTGQQMQLPSDLFLITPEPELSEFEIAIHRRLNLINGEDLSATELLEETKGMAAELLDLARKEILKDENIMTVSGPGFFAGGETRFTNMPIADALKAEYEKGKAEALKDLPRWGKWENGAYGNGRGNPLAIVKRGLNGYKLVDALSIQGEQYIMLSDLEKLPGFKED